MTLVTGTGTAVTVLHRLALGVTLIDHVTERPVLSRPSVVEERQRPDQSDDPTLPPLLVELAGRGGGRFHLNYDLSSAAPGISRRLRLRVVDPLGYYIPRRVEQDVRPLQRVLDADRPPSPGAPAALPVEAARRSVELWLFPGPAYPLRSGSTALRGQLMRDGVGVPWARIGIARATDPGRELGWTHGDEQGQFLVPLGDVRPVSRLTGPFVVSVVVPPATPPLPPDPGARLAPAPTFEPALQPGPGRRPGFQPTADPLQLLYLSPLPPLGDPPAPPSPRTGPSRGEYLPAGAQTFTVNLNGSIPLGRTRVETITIS